MYTGISLDSGVVGRTATEAAISEDSLRCAIDRLGVLVDRLVSLNDQMARFRGAVFGECEAANNMCKAASVADGGARRHLDSRIGDLDAQIDGLVSQFSRIDHLA